MDKFLTWVNTEIQERGWSSNQLARKIGITSSGLSKVMTEQNKVTWDFCFGVAKAFGYPPEDVFRRAGLLPPSPTPEKIQKLLDIARGLSEDELDNLVAYAQWRYEQTKKP